MAKSAEMNEKWWVKNKAKTMLDKGDKVQKALKKWDSVKANTYVDFKVCEKAMSDALGGVRTAASALLAAKTTSKIIHKETIGYLNTYQKNCETVAKLLNKTTLEGVKLTAKIVEGNAPIPILKNWKFFKMYQAEIMFLSVTKSGMGSQKVFDTFIVKELINLPSKIDLAIKKDAEEGKFDGDCWNDAFDNISNLFKTNAQLPKQMSQFIMDSSIAGLRKI
jgi:hypothetical protein